MELNSESLAVSRWALADLEAAEAEWNGLLSRTAADSIFLRWEWIQTWWKHFATPDRSLYVLAVRQSGQLVGLAPFYQQVVKSPRMKELRFCGDDVSPDHVDLIIAPGYEEAVGGALQGYLRANQADWDLQRLNNLAIDSLLLKHAGAARGEARFAHPCPYIRIEGDFISYLQNLERAGIHKLGIPKKIRQLERKAV